jgi:hypothetical protein
MLRALSNARWAGMGIGQENLKIYRGDTNKCAYRGNEIAFGVACGSHDNTF